MNWLCCSYKVRDGHIIVDRDAGVTQGVRTAIACSDHPSGVHEREKEQACSVGISAHFAFILASLYSSERHVISRKYQDRRFSRKGKDSRMDVSELGLAQCEDSFPMTKPKGP